MGFFAKLNDVFFGSDNELRERRRASYSTRSSRSSSYYSSEDCYDRRSDDRHRRQQRPDGDDAPSPRRRGPPFKRRSGPPGCRRIGQRKNRAADKRDSLNRSGDKADSPNRRAGKAESPNRGAGKGGTTKRVGDKEDSPNRCTCACNADSPNRRADKGDTPKRGGDKGDSPNRSAEGDSLNQSGDEGDSPNRRAGKKNGPNRGGDEGDSPNRGASKADRPHRRASKGDLPNRRAGKGNSSNQDTGKRDSLNQGADKEGSPHRGASKRDRPNRRTGKENHPNRGASRRDRPNQGVHKGDSPNRRAGKGNSPNRNGGKADSPNRDCDTRDDRPVVLRTLSGESLTPQSNRRRTLSRESTPQGQNAKPVYGSTKAPDYWQCRPGGLYKIYAVKTTNPLFSVFRDVLVTDKPHQLNKGRDVREVGKYSTLDLVGVWRVENATVWTNYAIERAHMKYGLESRNLRAPHLFLRKNLYDAIRKLPAAPMLWSSVNETYLIHGTVAEWIMPIVKNGLSPNLKSAALFGKGIYFAEDSAKNDQYVRGDSDINDYTELHKRIFPPAGAFPFPKPPYKAYYLILCRVLIGYPVHVKCTDAANRDMFNLHDENHPVFRSREETELADIPYSKPPLPYQSLVAEKGYALVRFREFAIFHGERAYPEYIMCYSRK